MIIIVKEDALLLIISTRPSPSWALAEPTSRRASLETMPVGRRRLSAAFGFGTVKRKTSRHITALYNGNPNTKGWTPGQATRSGPVLERSAPSEAYLLGIIDIMHGPLPCWPERPFASLGRVIHAIVCQEPASYNMRSK